MIGAIAKIAKIQAKLMAAFSLSLFIREIKTKAIIEMIVPSKIPPINCQIAINMKIGENIKDVLPFST